LTSEEEIARAERARQLLEEPLVKEAFSILEESFLNGIQTSAMKDEALREKLCQMLMVTRQVKQHLQSTMETGIFAQLKIQQESMWDKAKNVVGIR